MYLLKYKNIDVARFKMEARIGCVVVYELTVLNESLLPPPVCGCSDIDIAIRLFLESRIIPQRRSNIDDIIPRVFTGTGRERGRMGDLAYELSALAGFASGFDGYFVTPENNSVCVYGDIPTESIFFLDKRGFTEERNESSSVKHLLLGKNTGQRISLEDLRVSKSLTIPTALVSYWDNGQFVQHVGNTSPQAVHELIDALTEITCCGYIYEPDTGKLRINIPSEDFYLVGMLSKNDERYLAVRQLSQKYSVPLIMGVSKNGEHIIVFLD